VSVELLDDAATFGAAAGELLTARVDGTILATVLHAIRHGRYDDIEPRYAVVRDATGVVVAAALRTPPWPMLCCGLDPADADALLRHWLQHDPDLPGINATPKVARAIGDAWARRTGGAHALHTAMALHALEAVVAPPHATTGSLRRAGPADEDVVLGWWRAFAAEAHLQRGSTEATRAGRELIDGGRAYVWEDDGEPVSLIGHTVAIEGVPRLGPVYTPPECRGRGYAGHATAELSRRLLAGGARRCVLFTDLANPTSNKIYAEVGYRRISDWEVRSFAPAGQAGAESPTTG
jgi:hypothetical protein